MDLNIQRLPTVVLLPTMLLAVFVLVTAQALDLNLMDLMRNKNCSRYLHLQNDDENVSHHSLMCPPWYVETNDSSSRCTNGLMVHNEVYFMEGTQQPWMESLFCMTTSPNASSPLERDVVGSCLFSFHTYNLSFSTYYPLPCNISELNDYMCAGLNREGQLCGKCVKGFAPPVFSYSLNCVECTDYHLNWLKYVGVAFGPLTIFCLFICFFHVSAASPYLFGFVFYCQILSMPTIVRMAQNTHGYNEAKESTKFAESFYISFLSIWNLDILRDFYKPFCLHPNMSVVQALALDYVIALYPLALLLVAYSLINLYSRNVKFVVALWEPLGRFLRPCVRNLNIQTSLIESFATLYFLSAMKVQSVSLDLLSPTLLYYPDGTISKKLHLYLAGDVEYFGPHHFPYGLLALVLLVIFTLLPGLLLFFYPSRFFQQLLNKMNCNSVTLRTFVDVFQGNYKDGTNNTKDYRFFSGVFFLTRFVLMATFVILNSLYSVLIFGTILTMLGFGVAILHPQKTKLHYGFDCIILLLMSLLFFTIIADFIGTHNSIASQVARYYSYLSFFLPLVYIVCLVCYWMFVRKRIPQRFGCYVLKAVYSNYQEQQHLLKSIA